MKLSINSIFNLLLFLIVPVLGALRALLNINYRNSRLVAYFILAAFFSLLTIKSPPLGDLYRYLFRFDYINNLSQINEYTIDFTFGVFVLLFKYFGIPFYLFSSIFVFLGLLFLFLAIDELYLKYKWSSGMQIALIAISIIFFNPIAASIGLRSYLALSLFIYGVILVSDNKNKGYFFGLLAVLTHVSFSYLFIFLILSKFIKINNFQTALISIFLFFVSNFAVPILFQYFALYQGGGYYGSYVESDYEYNSANEFLGYLIDISSYSILLILYFFSKNSGNDKFLIKIRFIINLLIVSVFLACSVKTAFGRYFSYVSFLMMFVVFVENFFYKKNKIPMVILVLISIIFLSLNNTYYRRDSILNGKFFEMMLVSPLFLLNYSDREYRKLVSMVDSEGFINK